MALTKYAILIFISLILIVFSVRGDDKLIEQECSNAAVPAACLHCIRSHPGASQADPVGLASILISCLSSQATALAGSMSSMASRASGNDKPVLDSCAKDFLQACHVLSTATSQLKAGHYDDANHSIGTALDSQLSCAAAINQQKLHIPSTMLYQTRLYQELSDAALRIIDRF